MADFEKAIEEAITNGDIPGCVLVATNRDGSFTYNKAFGHSTLNPSKRQTPLALNSIMWTASCTKLQTSICLAQLVERGLLTYDAPIYTHIPELADFPILTGFREDGTPITTPHTKPITLRTLLHHTSGLVYHILSPLTAKWMAQAPRPPAGSTVLDRYVAPMIFEPGEGWMYAPGIDFAGLLLERITGMTLEEYMRENLWTPLGITDMTFFPSTRPDLRERMADISFRQEDGKVGFREGGEMYYGDAKERIVCMGGDGIFTSAPSYLKILHALLTTTTDSPTTATILKPETIQEFFRPQLNPTSREALELVLQDEWMNNAMGGTARGVGKDWGLGGLLITGDAPDGKKKGTMCWGGLPNLTWWADRETGVCGLWAAQLLPTGDGKVAALARGFERGIYELLGEGKKEGSRL
ncbi:beta-lactamase/transpeptidase-like protein [Byssothecium circinans]|uniref:Beta-lactamase/transpeptidase-like protein n=1 Tax=Byssothecium circinans TaxID=147558 RepID=A0A6A5TY07_9PLEO|nr:beta-lactamase/transpeptidase-like protein [Byssothecium circinans]